jgi:hypothetical protein
MSNIKFYRELAKSIQPDGLSFADVAAETYGDDYYSDPGRYETEIVLQRLNMLEPNNPLRLESMAAAVPGITPDMSYAAITSGLAGDSELVQQLVTFDEQQAAVRAAQELAANEQRTIQLEEAEELRNFQATENTFDDWGPFSAVRGVVRTAFSAISAPFQIMMNAYRAYGGAVMEAMGPESIESQTTSGLETFTEIFTATDLGQMSQDLLVDGVPFQGGDGWFGVDPNSPAGIAIQEAQGRLWTLPNGDIATLGRSVAYTAGAEKGSVWYDMLSGAIDFTTYAADPAMYVGAGALKAAGKSAVGFAKGGKEGANAARAKSDGSAVAKGTDAARAAADEQAADVARLREVDEISRARSATLSEARAASDAARDEAVSASARSTVAARAAAEYTERAAAKRRAAIEVEEQYFKNRKIREGELLAARDKAQSQLDRLKTLRESLNRAKEEFNWAPGKPIPDSARVTDSGLTIFQRTAKEIEELEKLNPERLLKKANKALEDFAARPAGGFRYMDGVKLQTQIASKVTRLRNIAKELDETYDVAAKQALDDAAEEAVAWSRWATLRQQADEIQEQVAKANEEVAGVREALSTKYGIPDELNDTDAVREYLESSFGITKTMTGDKAVNVELALDAITKGKMDRIAVAMSKIDDPSIILELTRGKISDPSTLKALARADTPEKVKAVFTGALASGDLGHNIGKLKGLRTFSRMVGDRPYIDELGRFNTAFGPGARAVRWSLGAKERRTSWSYNMHIEDGSGMARGMLDYIEYTTKSWNRAEKEVFRREWLNKLIDAESGYARKSVMYDMLNDLTERALKADAGLTPTEIDEFRAVFKSTEAARMGLRSYNTNSRALAGEDRFRLLGKEVGDGNLPLLEEMMNEHFWFPDPRKVRRLVKSAKAIKKRGGDPGIIKQTYQKLFDDYWRAWVLAKPSYIVREAIEAQTRMYLAGHPSAFTNPGTILSMGLSSLPGGPLRQSMSKFLRAWNVADIDVTGKAFTRNFSADDAANKVMSDWVDLLNNRTSLLDVGSPAALAKYRTLGYTTARRGETGYWTGVANDVIIRNSDELSREVLGVAAGVPSKRVIDWASQKGMTHEEALIDMAFSGQYRKALDGVAEASGNKVLSEALATREGVAELLFGRENPFSYWSNWNNYTGGFDADIVTLLRSGNYQRRSLGNPAAQDARNADGQLTSLADAFRGRFAADAKDGKYLVEEVVVPLRGAKADNRGLWDKIGEGLPDAVFRVTGMEEKAFRLTPELRFAYWDTVEKMLPGMSPAAARKILERAEESLGKTFMGIPTSTWSRAKLDEIRKGVKFAEGEMSVDDIHRIAMAESGRTAKDLFYRAGNRNQVAHQMRLLTPFVQSWANSIRVYGRLLTEKSETAYRAGVMFNQAQTPESNLTYRLAEKIPGDPLGVSGFDPEQGFLFVDPKSQQLSVKLPGASTAVGLLAGILSRDTSPVDMSINTPVESMQMIVQEGVGPGFSSPVQLLAGQIKSTDLYQNLPGWAKVLNTPAIADQLDSPRAPDISDQGFLGRTFLSLVPGPLRGFLAYAGLDFAREAEKYRVAARGYVWADNPGKYVDPATGKITVEGSQILVEDGDKLARAMALATTTVRWVSPGSLLTELYLEMGDGTLITQYALGQEFTELRNRYGGDEGLAWLELRKKYGTAPLMAMMSPAKDAVFPSSEAWSFIQENIDVLGKHDSRTLEMFFHGGNWDREYAKYLTEYEQGRQLTPEEHVAKANMLMYSAQKDQLARANEAGTLSDEDYQEQAAQLKAAYIDVLENDIDTYSFDRQLARIDSALTDERLASIPSGKAIKTYMLLRDEALARLGVSNLKSFDSKAAAEMRQWLFEAGTQLATETPGFRDAWWFFFSNEVKPK